MSSVSRCSTSIVPCILITSVAFAQEKPALLCVAQNGNDAWSGALNEPNAASTDGPFKTIERARDAIRAMKTAGGLPKGGVTVQIRRGTYCLEKTLEFTAEDSGTAESPIVYSGFANEEVRLVGGKFVNNFAAVTDAAVLARLDPRRARACRAGRPQGARHHRLRRAGRRRPGTVLPRPADDAVPLAERGLRADRGPGRRRTGIRSTAFRAARSASSPTTATGRSAGSARRTCGCTATGSGTGRTSARQIESIDTEKPILAVVPPYHGYGYRKGQWYYAFNVLAELDTPGEWYLDRETGILYFWPPAPVAAGRDASCPSLDNALCAKDVSHVTLRGLTLEASRGTAVTISGGAHNRIAGCTIRNIGGSGRRVSAAAGQRRRRLRHLPDGRGRHQPERRRPQDAHARRTSSPRTTTSTTTAAGAACTSAAIALSGVGNRAAHNLIHDAPHMAIGFGGNDHVIEFNEIHSVCYESNDAGAIYAGRDWTMRGHVIRYNYLHHINGFEAKGCVGVYLDDMFASAAIVGNVFYKVTRPRSSAADATTPSRTTSSSTARRRCTSTRARWAGPHEHADDWIKEEKEKGTISGIAYNKPPYSERFPQLVNIIDDEPKAPKGNLIARNICVGGKWDDVEEKARGYQTFQDNLLNEDPHFVDAANKDFRLKDDSPAWKLGFKPIPVEKIGPYQDPDRASWPIVR